MNGVEYVSEEWPHGLMCMDCDRVFVDGDRYSERLHMMQDDIPVVEIVCVKCAFGRDLL